MYLWSWMHQLRCVQNCKLLNLWLVEPCVTMMTCHCSACDVGQHALQECQHEIHSVEVSIVSEVDTLQQEHKEAMRVQMDTLTRSSACHNGSKCALPEHGKTTEGLRRPAAAADLHSAAWLPSAPAHHSQISSTRTLCLMSTHVKNHIGKFVCSSQATPCL